MVTDKSKIQTRTSVARSTVVDSDKHKEAGNDITAAQEAFVNLEISTDGTFDTNKILPESEKIEDKFLNVLVPISDCARIDDRMERLMRYSGNVTEAISEMENCDRLGNIPYRAYSIIQHKGPGSRRLLTNLISQVNSLDFFSNCLIANVTPLPFRSKANVQLPKCFALNKYNRINNQVLDLEKEVIKLNIEKLVHQINNCIVEVNKHWNISEDKHMIYYRIFLALSITKLINKSKEREIPTDDRLRVTGLKAALAHNQDQGTPSFSSSVDSEQNIADKTYNMADLLNFVNNAQFGDKKDKKDEKKEVKIEHKNNKLDTKKSKSDSNKSKNMQSDTNKLKQAKINREEIEQELKSEQNKNFQVNNRHVTKTKDYSYSARGPRFGNDYRSIDTRGPRRNFDMFESRNRRPRDQFSSNNYPNYGWPQTQSFDRPQTRNNRPQFQNYRGANYMGQRNNHPNRNIPPNMNRVIKSFDYIFKLWISFENRLRIFPTKDFMTILGKKHDLLIEMDKSFPLTEITIKYNHASSLKKLFREIQFPESEMIFFPIFEDLESEIKEELNILNIEWVFTGKPNYMLVILDANKISNFIFPFLVSKKRLNYIPNISRQILKPILGLKSPPILKIGQFSVPNWIMSILEMGIKFIPFFNMKSNLYPSDIIYAINSSGLPLSFRTKLIKFAKNIRENILLNHLVDEKADRWSRDIRTLKNFLSNNDLECKPSDKGGRIVLMNKSFYSKKCLKLLEMETDYELADASEFSLSILVLKNSYEEYSDIFPKFLTRKQIVKGINALSEPRIGRFYGLPKVHKNADDPPMRPVVSLTNHPTNIFAVLADAIIQNYIWSFDHVVQSTDKMISILKDLSSQLNFSWNKYKLVACDITALYTSIPIEKGVLKVSKFIKSKGLMPHFTRCIEDTLSTIMKSNYFEFNNNIYRQIKGVAMGSPVGPSFANVYLLDLDQEFIKYKGVIKYFRYIDDIFMIVENNLEIDIFLQHINSLDAHIKFTIESEGQSINFLDITIYIEENLLQYQLFEKPISSLTRYVPSHSAHTPNMSDSIISGVIVRCLKLCSNKFTALLLINRIKTLRFTHNKYEIDKIPRKILKYIEMKDKRAKIKEFSDDTIVAVSPSHPYIHLEKEILIKPFNDLINSFFGYQRIKLVPLYTKSSNLCEYLVRAKFDFEEEDNKPNH